MQEPTYKRNVGLYVDVPWHSPAPRPNNASAHASAWRYSTLSCWSFEMGSFGNQDNFDAKIFMKIAKLYKIIYC